MAKFSGNFWRGVAGDVTFREHRGQQIVTGASRLTKDQMTEGSLKAADTFGAASGLNNYIRPTFNFKGDGNVSGRLDGMMNICLDRSKNKKLDIFEFDKDSFNYMAGFEFNENTPLKKHFYAQPKVVFSGLNLQIQIPTINTKKEIKFHPDAHHAKPAVSLGMFDIINGQYTYAEVQNIEILAGQSKPTFPARYLDFILSPGCLCIVALSLVYIENTFLGPSFLNSTAFSPAAILHATLSEGNPEPKEDWDDMDIVFITEVPPKKAIHREKA
ncbi:hypothetical protein ACXZ1K_07335 [Pedobacter sp. PWIIR3]